MGMVVKGIGYQAVKRLRFDEGYTATSMEEQGNEQYILYFGRPHVVDHETGLESRGPLKIGRGKFLSALLRGRNQPGVDFRIYAAIIVSTNAETHMIERVAQDLLKDRNIKGSQGQRELYNISDDELFFIVNDIAEVAIDCHDINVVVANFFENDQITQSLDFKEERVANSTQSTLAHLM
jgi:hypothetical protein